MNNNVCDLYKSVVIPNNAKRLFTAVFSLFICITLKANYLESKMRADGTYLCIKYIPCYLLPKEGEEKLDAVITNLLANAEIIRTSDEKSFTNNSPDFKSILNTDGSLKTGEVGTFNATGFNLHYAKNGAPIFSAASNSNCGQWDSKFNLSGLNGNVNTIAINGNKIYVGGSFSMAGGTNVNNIAVWNGSNWSGLGTGVSKSGRVNAIAVIDSNVYVGGSFSMAGSITANNIAVWNGIVWAPLGNGVNSGSAYDSPVSAIVVNGDKVYAGGNFTTAGNAAASHIAMWNGSAWSSLGTGVNGTVFTLAVDKDNIYAGGWLDTAGGVSANRIAMWNGNTWSALGTGLGPSTVNVIVVSGNRLYVGGNIETAGGNPVNNIAVWDGSTWSALGTGLNSYVQTIAIDGSKVYAGGSFTTAGGNAAKSIAVWDGNTWNAIGSGFNNPYNGLSAVAINGNKIYAGGYFTKSNGNGANFIAVWEGTNWSSVDPVTSTYGNGLNGTVNVVTISGNNVYVGGYFTEAGGMVANNVAVWNGTAWAALGNGVDGFGISSLAVNGGNLYAGGYFSTAGGTPANNIAVWNGTTWLALGNGINGSVNAIALSGGNVYAGGSFSAAGSNPANNIAVWNGSSWSALASGTNGQINALASSSGNIYAGGNFSAAGGIPAGNIAVWNGGSWAALGSGVNGSGISSIAVNGASIYVGGSFNMADGNSARNVAVWNGTSWSALGNGVNGRVNTISVSGDNIYVGGNFSTAGSNSARNVAAWNGSAWSALDIGINTIIYSIAVSGTNVYEGGSYYSTDGNPASNFNMYLSCFALPIKSLDLTGRVNSNQALLQWQTSGEIFTDSFIIEKSTDGVSYHLIGSVAATGNITLSRYHFTDIAQVTGTNYYRLKMTDKDGSFSYSKVITVSILQDLPSIKVFPNPASTTSVVYFNHAIKSAEVAIFDQQGKKVFADSFNGLSTTAYQLHLASLLPGTYILSIKTTLGSFSERLIISK